MEIAVFIAVIVLALVLGFAIQFLSFAIGTRVLRFPDATLARAFRVMLLVQVMGWGTGALEFLLKALGAPDTFVFIPATVVFILVCLCVVKRAYATTTGRAFGALGFTLVAGLLFIFPLRAFGIQAFKIPAGSMLPTISIGDHLLVSKYAYLWSEPRRGDLVVFVYPPDPSKDFIKRIIGLPGEEVKIEKKTVLINGQPMQDPWGRHAEKTVPPATREKRDYFGPVKVPAGQFFVLGDNRDGSYDSRFWGFVPRENLKGKAMVRYWPPSHMGRVN
jgi:signal peptidase I